MDLSSTLSGASNPPNGGQVSSLQPLPNEVQSTAPAPQTTPNSLNASIAPNPTTNMSSPGQDLSSLAPEKQHVLGRAVGSIFKGLSGTETNYSIDPNTGKTVTSTAPAPKGQWARGILAAGLLGATGINPEHGEKGFAQGMLAGLSGGAKAYKDQSEEADAKKRAQAQQDYANQLKANEEQRANKEQSLRETLNKAQVAHDNMETAVQSQILHDHLKGEESAASSLEVEGSKGKLKDYLDADEDPVQEGLDSGQVSDFINNHTAKGAVANYVGIASGMKLVKDANGVNHAVTTYSIFQPLTKVPESLIARMKAAGVDKTSPTMFKELSAASANQSTIEYKKIAAGQREVAKSTSFQDLLDVHRKNQAEINRANLEGGAAYIRANKDKYEYNKEVSQDNGEQQYNARFNPVTGALDTKDLNPKDRADLTGYFNRMNQYLSSELFKYEKKNEDGTYSLSDPAAIGISNTQNLLKKGLENLEGKVTAAPAGGEVENYNSLQSLQSKVIADAPPHLSNSILYFITDVTTKNAQGVPVVIPAATTLDEAVQRLSSNQSIPKARLSTSDYASVVNALKEYYQNVGPIQQQVSDKVNKENAENRFVTLNALNPDITRENQNQYKDDGTPATSHVSHGGAINFLTGSAPN